MTKNIVWVHRLGPQFASYRYRSQVPCEEVGKINGFRTAINNGEADVVIFSKPMADELEMAEKAKKEGAKIVVDFCDDHFQDAEAETYRAFAEIGDAFVTSSTIMRGRLYDYVKADSAVIPDPYEQPECEPHADGDHYLWFGHFTNLKEITQVAHVIGNRKLLVATGPKAPNDKLVIWGPEALKAALAQSNIVLLPTREGVEYKTANRLLNAIRSGCFSVCMTHPAYKEFRDFVWVGHFPTGLRWAESFRADLNALVKSAQDYIRDRYSPKTIGEQWASFLHSL